MELILYTKSALQNPNSKNLLFQNPYLCLDLMPLKYYLLLKSPLIVLMSNKRTNKEERLQILVIKKPFCSNNDARGMNIATCLEAFKISSKKLILLFILLKIHTALSKVFANIAPQVVETHLLALYAGTPYFFQNQGCHSSRGKFSYGNLNALKLVKVQKVGVTGNP